MVVLQGITPSKVADDRILISTHTKVCGASLRRLQRRHIDLVECVHVAASSAESARSIKLGQSGLELMKRSAMSKSEGEKEKEQLLTIATFSKVFTLSLLFKIGCGAGAVPVIESAPGAAPIAASPSTSSRAKFPGRIVSIKSHLGVGSCDSIYTRERRRDIP